MGAGGCGKSRVAIEVAREVRFDFPEGVWCVDLSDLSEKAGTNYRNVAVWFATTGKKNPKIKKVAPATYKLAA